MTAVARKALASPILPSAFVYSLVEMYVKEVKYHHIEHRISGAID
jgi:hypothetical protein